MSVYRFLQNKQKICGALSTLLGIVIFSFFAFGFFKDTKFPYVLAANTPSPDAIAIRVIPNPNHYSVSRWYSQQGFKGSPQTLTVDGYEALRDGRTVYVNAANVTLNNEGKYQLYTNIYLISYNQEAEAATQNILGQIIAHWKFNANLAGLFPDLVNGQCNQTAGIVCLTEADCPQSQYCDSQKAKITRDTKRLSRLAEIKMAIEDYKNKRISGYYPKLAAGTYLAGKTISTWPSWQQTLAKELGVGLPTDPINKLGACKDPEDKNYDPATCWNEKDKLFAGTISADGTLNLPVGSQAFVYTGAANGLSYNVCAVMESGLIIDLKAGACAGSAAVKHGGATGNNLPTITCGSLIGTSGKEFIKGYISADDPDKDKLAWSIDTTGTTWTNWSANPTLKDTVNSNQKEVYAKTAGDKGSYNFSVIVNDGRGEPVKRDCTINIYSACKTNGVCDGNCPDGCTATDDPDCKTTGCRPGDGRCDITDLANECGAGDCGLAECCEKNSTCDSLAGETPENCSDCVSAVSGCVFPFDFPCTF